MDTSLHITILISITFNGCWGEYGDRIKNATITWGANLQMEESQHYGYAVLPSPKPRTELPINFQAPFINAPDYWTPPPRRTAPDFSYYNPKDLIFRPINEGFNTIYGLMSNLFIHDQRPQKTPPHPNPSEYESHYNTPNRPYEYYIPPPKPIRASIQKLEPQINPYYQKPPKRSNYPEFVKILNDVLIENAFNHPATPPVLEKPDFDPNYLKPTTYKPKYRIPTRTTPKTFPVSIQDQLPPLKQGQNIEIPYVIDQTAKTPSKVSFITESTTRHPLKKYPNRTTRVQFPTQTDPVPQLDFEIDVRAGPVVTTTPLPQSFVTPLPTLVYDASTHNTVLNTATTEKIETQPISPETSQKLQVQQNQTPAPTTTEASQFIVETTTASQFVPNDSNNVYYSETTAETTTTTTEPVTTPPIKSEPSTDHQQSTRPEEVAKKIHSRKVTTDSTQSVDYVTDLTLQGVTQVHAIPQYSNPNSINRSRVLGYVINKLNATAPPFYDDELSLDAKILKDTNWDGYQPSLPTTVNTPVLTSTVPTAYPWTTTTEMPWITIAPPTTQPNEIPIETVIATRVTQSISKTRNRERPRERTTTESIINPRMMSTIDDTYAEPTTEIPTTTKSARRSRKYRRKPRVRSFTNSSTTTSTPASVDVASSQPLYRRRTTPNMTVDWSNKRTIEYDNSKNGPQRRRYVIPRRKKISTTEESNLEINA